jgi:hypothetical protein
METWGSITKAGVPKNAVYRYLDRRRGWISEENRKIETERPPSLTARHFPPNFRETARNFTRDDKFQSF